MSAQRQRLNKTTQTATATIQSVSICVADLPASCCTGNRRQSWSWHDEWDLTSSDDQPRSHRRNPLWSHLTMTHLQTDTVWQTDGQTDWETDRQCHLMISLGFTAVFFHAESVKVTQQRHTYRQTQCDRWTDRQTDNVIWWSASVSLQKPAMKSLDNNTPTDRQIQCDRQTERETDRDSTRFSWKVSSS